eukprot:146919_1
MRTRHYTSPLTILMNSIHKNDEQKQSCKFDYNHCIAFTWPITELNVLHHRAISLQTFELLFNFCECIFVHNMMKMNRKSKSQNARQFQSEHTQMCRGSHVVCSLNSIGNKTVAHTDFD